MLDGYVNFSACADGRMDGWMGGWMDRCMLGGGGGGRSGGFGCLVCWLLGGFVGSGRVVAWLVDRLVGTPLMGAWTDGCCVNGEGAAPPPQCKPSLPRTGFLASTALGEKWGKHGVMWFGCLACWLLGWFVGLAALLLGWLAPRRWMDGWMDGWMGGSCAASRSGRVRVSFRHFPSFQTVSAQFPEGFEGLVTRSCWGENKGFGRCRDKRGETNRR